MTRARALLLVLLLGCGCPRATTESAPTTEPAGEAAPSPVEQSPTPAPAVSLPPPAAGPVGPTRHTARIPRPSDGRPQTSLLQTRSLTLGEVTLEAWIAEHGPSRTLGLMHVRSMPDGKGMLFVYPDVRRRAFWMRNTYIPLSLAYIRADGTIDQLLDMRPLTENSHPSTTAVKFVLEVNQGWFKRNGVAVGTRLEGLEGLRGF